MYEELDAFLDEFGKETDRACAVLGAAYLDEILRKSIETFFPVKNKLDDLMNGPLSGLHTRILVAHCLGIIDDDMCDDLMLIKKIRNEFAHQIHGLTFSEHKIVNWCASLKHWKMSDLQLDSKGKFILTVAIIAYEIERARIL